MLHYFQNRKPKGINTLCFFGRYATANSRYASVELDDHFSIERLSECFNGERSSKQWLQSSCSALFITWFHVARTAGKTRRSVTHQCHTVWASSGYCWNNVRNFADWVVEVQKIYNWKREKEKIVACQASWYLFNYISFFQCLTGMRWLWW